ncbi:MAG: PD-(D/E)XK nuclease family protein [Treponema sp.]|jgi:hypothetical protein|nr:PD-(D/E)XK nuclease family protein [Treponema sp.]
MSEQVTHQAARLLACAAETRKRFEEQYRVTGSKFNIFTITGTKNKEVQMCRVLANLLNPEGSHCQGSLYLKTFWETVLSKLPEALRSLDFDAARVSTEYVIDENRRIDIVIEDGRVFVPIEVKIRAGDQEKQVSDYAAFSRNRNRGAPVPVLYLTLDGHRPQDAGEGEYRLFSFSQDILPWLKKCRDKPETALPVREILKQLIAAVETLCNTSGDEEMDEIFKLITRSEDSVKAALAIREAVGLLEPHVKKAFTGSIIDLVKKTFPDAEGPLDSDGWYYIEIPIKQEKYSLSVNYDWKSLCMNAFADTRDAGEEKVLSQKMNGLTGDSGTSWGESSGVFWANKKKLAYPTLASVDESLYFYELYKLYTERPQEVLDRIVSMACALEAVVSKAA